MSGSAATLRNVAVMKPRLPSYEALEQYLRRIDMVGTYSNFGPLYEEFRERLAVYFGLSADRVTLLANGTLALQSAIETVGSAGDTWVVPSWTFVATGQAVLAARRRIHFADVQRDTWALRAEPRSFAKGHVIVAPFGARPAVEEWSGIDGHKIIDAASCFDACQGIGPRLDDDTILMVSLHATKPLAAGEGAVLIGPPDWIERARVWGNFGFDGSRVANGPGLNAKMSEYHAAIGLCSLDHWVTTRALWQPVLDRVRGIGERLGLEMQPSLREGVMTTTWNVVLPDGVDLGRAEVVLEQRNVSTRRWWPTGVHEMPAFRSQNRDALPVTESLRAAILGLPIGLHLSADDITRVEQALDAVVRSRS